MSDFVDSSVLPENNAAAQSMDVAQSMSAAQSMGAAAADINILKMNDPRGYPSTNARKCVRDVRGVYFTLHLIKLENEHSDNIQVTLCALSQLSGVGETDFMWRYDYTFNMTADDTGRFDTLLETLNTDNFTLEFNNQHNQMIFTVCATNTRYVLGSSVKNTPFSFTDHFNVEKLTQEIKRLKDTLASFRQTFMATPQANGCGMR